MQHGKAYFKRTRRGKVLRIVEDHYLRDDLGCGTLAGKQLRQDDLLALVRESPLQLLLVLDTNILLSQLTLLESQSLAFFAVVIPQTALQECRHRDLTAFRQLSQLLHDDRRGFIYFANEHHSDAALPRGKGVDGGGGGRGSGGHGGGGGDDGGGGRGETAGVPAKAAETVLALAAMEVTEGDGAATGTEAASTVATIESPNDRNDRAIRRVAAWYASQLGDAGKVILLTDDRENRRLAAADAKAAAAGYSGYGVYTAQSVRKFAESVEARFPGTADLVADATDAADFDEDGVVIDDGGGGGAGRVSGAGGRAAATGPRGKRQRPLFFEEHRPMAELTKGLREGRYFQGTMRSKATADDCYVVVQGLESLERVAVFVKGWDHVNRALDGDIVALEMLPRDQWERRLGGGGPGASGRDESGAWAGGKEARAAEGAAGAAGASREEEEEVAVDMIPEPTAPPEVEDIENVDKLPELRPTGKVVGIVRRNWRQYCGSIEPAGDRLVADGRVTSALFVAVDRKVPKVRIQTRQRAALEGKRILVAPDSWPAWCRYPLGHYVKTLGDAGDKAIETEVILLEHDIPHTSFSGKVLACLPPVDWAITPDNSRGRADFRHLPVLSIDPPGCKDIDDALHVRLLDNGNFEAGVHIADVTHFVEAGSAMDLEAASRSTSTYLVDRRLDMLPGLLTETLCSLRAGVDRFAFSVLWEMTPEGDVVKVDFTKSIIHSVAALTYDQAQLMLDDPKLTDEKAVAVRWLNHIAKIFRARRIEAGALTLASPEVKFVLDMETQNPTDVQAYALKEANALVEEFMLLANITVSKKILRHFPTLSVLRRHPAPSRQQFDVLVSSAAAVGVDISVETSKHLADSLDAAVREGDPYFNKLLRILSTRCMSPAAYFCSGDYPQAEWHHYGLAAPVYTHFTSPIRRYADVVVHRLLGSAIGIAPLPPPLADRRHLHDLTENMNRRHRAAQMAGRGSVGLHTTLFFRCKPAEAEAYVLSVFKDRATVLVPRYGIEGSVLFKGQADAALLTYDPGAHTLRYTPASGTNRTAETAETAETDGGAHPGARPAQLRVFDRVQVRIRVNDGGDGGSSSGGGGSCKTAMVARNVAIDLLSPDMGCELFARKKKTGDEKEKEPAAAAAEVAVAGAATVAAWTAAAASTAVAGTERPVGGAAGGGSGGGKGWKRNSGGSGNENAKRRQRS